MEVGLIRCLKNHWLRLLGMAIRNPKNADCGFFIIMKFYTIFINRKLKFYPIGKGCKIEIAKCDSYSKSTDFFGGLPFLYLIPIIWIRCTFWFDAGSRIIGNNLRGWFFLLLAPAGSSNPAGPSHYSFPNTAGQS